ncbi:MAG TPA: hypothetical protein VE242_05595 [Chthoniobacterales bacterium]|nr:hypothetical protein [Chthoniobacterales bacterium]
MAHLFTYRMTKGKDYRTEGVISFRGLWEAVGPQTWRSMLDRRTWTAGLPIVEIGSLTRKYRNVCLA